MWFLLTGLLFCEYIHQIHDSILVLTSVSGDLITSGQLRQIAVYIRYIDMCLKCTSSDQLWSYFKERISDFRATYITHCVNVLLHVDKAQKKFTEQNKI